MKKRDSDYLYVIKSIAIFLVVCCHSVQKVRGVPIIEIKFLQSLSNIGVILFFIVSGILYKDYSYKEFIKKKLKVIVPWILYGTTVYLYVFIRDLGNISLISYFNWIIGNGTYLYYLTCYILIYLVFIIFKNKKIRVMLSLGSFLSLIFTSICTININPYLNIFNWLIYFYIGIALKKKNVQKEGNTTILLSVLVLICSFIYSLQFSYTYWNIVFVLTSFGVAISIMKIVYFLNINEMMNKILIYIGKISFFIYLNHMLFIGICKTFIVSLFPTMYIFMPCFVIILCCIEYELIKNVFIYLKKEKLLKYFIMK